MLLLLERSCLRVPELAIYIPYEVVSELTGTHVFGIVTVHPTAVFALP